VAGKHKIAQGPALAGCHVALFQGGRHVGWVCVLSSLVSPQGILSGSFIASCEPLFGGGLLRPQNVVKRENPH